MADFRDFIAFSPSAESVPLIPAGMDVSVNPALQKQIENAFAEIASTPEGAEWLREAAGRYPDGKIHIISARGATTGIGEYGLVIDPDDSAARYEGANTGEYHNITLQNMLVHELIHVVRGHSMENEQINMDDELEAIQISNGFMRKYYGAPERSADYNAVDLEGSGEWDYDTNFRREGYKSLAEIRSSLTGLSEQQVQQLSPEMQSLYAYRNNDEKFARQYEELRSGGGLQHVEDDVRTLDERNTTPEYSVTPHPVIKQIGPALSPSP